ncbi:response regulator transcription factor [Sinorhizobium meliloti]|uniref:response regulator transcription factor n=1 Tax=Rhizobium meliloti TaxID=382 RepID=UPI000FD81990|nr:response regulator transcription factor [Sinorhizobium meliloti]RVE84328.1 DNA-binding response regulator [Sinorhizobium meliloti]RVH25044.1 DNA-binding response regulator [Sinorhizobium meliloti]
MNSVALSYNNTALRLPVMSVSSSDEATNGARDNTVAGSALLLLDNRTLDRECLAECLVLHGLGSEVLAFGSVSEWRNNKDLHPPVAAIILNIGGRKVTDPSNTSEITDLVTEFGPTPVVVLSDLDELAQILKALECGVRGYIPSSIGFDICVQAVNLARAGGTFVPASSILSTRQITVAAGEVSRPLGGMFTQRQEEVIRALRRGKANKIIAYELNLRESTVKVHIRNIMKKLKATNRTEVAYKLGDMFPAEIGELEKPGLPQP